MCCLYSIRIFYLHIEVTLENNLNSCDHLNKCNFPESLCSICLGAKPGLQDCLPASSKKQNFLPLDKRL